MAWHGQLDEHWFLVVHARLPGQPLDVLDASTVEDLLALVELQTGLGTVGGGGMFPGGSAQSCSRAGSTGGAAAPQTTCGVPELGLGP